MTGRRFRIKPNPRDAHNSGTHSFFVDHVGEVLYFQHITTPHRLAELRRYYMIGDFYSHQGYVIHESQLETIEPEFIFERTGKSGYFVKSASDAGTLAYVGDNYDMSQMDDVKRDMAYRVRAHEAGIEYVTKLRENAANSEKQAYIDALSPIITPEAAGALYDAGIKMSKD